MLTKQYLYDTIVEQKEAEPPFSPKYNGILG